MVLVSNTHDFIFLKTRKTAGTSVEMALEPLCVPPGTVITEPRPASFTEYGIVGRRGDRWKLKGWKAPLRLWEWRNHQSAAFVRRMIGQNEWDRRKKITAIRNPFDRMVSYFHFVHHRKADPDADFSVTKAEFKDFLFSRRWRDDRRIVFLKGRFIIDHAVRQEHLVDDLKSVAATLNLPLEESWLPVTKSMARVRKAHDVPDYYDRATIEHVRKRLAWVFDHYDYPPVPQPRFAAESTVPEPEVTP